MSLNPTDYTQLNLAGFRINLSTQEQLTQISTSAKSTKITLDLDYKRQSSKRGGDGLRRHMYPLDEDTRAAHAHRSGWSSVR